MESLAVWKYPLGIPTKQPTRMQRGAKILSVGVQHEQITVWALVNTEEETVWRNILVVGTGHVYEESSFGKKFIGTVFLQSFVFHLFDGGEM